MLIYLFHVKLKNQEIVLCGVINWKLKKFYVEHQASFCIFLTVKNFEKSLKTYDK